MDRFFSTAVAKDSDAQRPGGRIHFLISRPRRMTALSLAIRCPDSILIGLPLAVVPKNARLTDGGHTDARLGGQATQARNDNQQRENPGVHNKIVVAFLCLY